MEEQVSKDEELWLDFRLLEIDLQLSTAKEQLVIIEEQIAKSQQTAKFALKAGLEKLIPTEDDDEYEEQMLRYEHDYHVQTVLPRVYRDPFIVVLFAVYESAVTEIAELMQRQLGQQISINDLKGSFLDRANKYYKNILHFELLNENERWKRLRVLSVVRNFIAHNNGRLDLARDSTRKVLRREGFIGEYGFISVGEEFLGEMFTVVTEEVKDLEARYKEWDTARNGSYLRIKSKGT